MDRKTSSIIVIVTLVIIVIGGWQLNRATGQKKLNAVFAVVRTELSLTDREKISGCSLGRDWYAVMASQWLWLVKDKIVYLADFNKNAIMAKKRWPKIKTQPTEAPLIDAYYLLENCIW
jgi:hypothetical protein